MTAQEINNFSVVNRKKYVKRMPMAISILLNEVNANVVTQDQTTETDEAPSKMLYLTTNFNMFEFSALLKKWERAPVSYGATDSEIKFHRVVCIKSKLLISGG